MRDNYDMNGRLEDSQEVVLSACSSLTVIVNLDRSRVEQFLQFSVKEYVSLERLANVEKHLFLYHILPRSAHTTLAQASEK